MGLGLEAGGLSAFLEAEEVAQMEVDKVRKAKEERDLDAKGDDALMGDVECHTG